MTQYNFLNVKLSNSKLLKIRNKNGTEVTLNISSNDVGGFNDGNNFSYNLLSTNTHVSKLCKAFANNYSANINLSIALIRIIRRLFRCSLRSIAKNWIAVNRKGT